MAAEQIVLAGMGDAIGILIIAAVIIGRVILAAARQKARKEQEEARRPVARRASRPAAETAAPRDEVQTFLEELARQSGLVRPQRPAQPPARPAERPLPKAQPVARRPARPVRRAATRRRPQAKPPTPEAVSRRFVPPSMKKKAAVPTAPRPAPAPGAAGRLESLFPSSPLKRAIVLRDVLGPCRAMSPLTPFEW